MKLLSAALAAISVMAFTQMDAKLDADKIPGTYISEAIDQVIPDTGQHNISSEILVFHSDGTAERIVSGAIGGFGASQNDNGIVLTPSFGTWEIDCKDDTVKAVFFEYFDFPPCDSCDSCPGEPVVPPCTCTNGCPPADQQIWIEYDRITYTIRFSDVKNCKYQSAIGNARLIGILQSRCQSSTDPTVPFTTCPPKALTILDGYNDPFLPLQSDDYLTTNKFLDAVFLDTSTTPPTEKPSLVNGIIYHRVNVQKNYIYPPAP